MNTDEITEKILGCGYSVSNELGVGFLEKVYENALLIELRKQGLHVEPQKHVSVTYSGHIVGEYIADLVVERCVIVELKAVKSLERIHQAQLLNYLKATEIHTGLLLNFGTSRLGIKRMLYGNSHR
ncbi:MAG: GxxExxY protein [Proteobacteria bacterium]|nr:MAG: GxxExxY protein [Pseudomonadota bacterium]